MTTLFDSLHDGRACRIVKLHTNLHEGLAVGEFIQKSERGLFAVEVTRDDYISLAHNIILFLIYIFSFKVLI